MNLVAVRRLDSIPAPNFEKWSRSGACNRRDCPGHSQQPSVYKTEFDEAIESHEDNGWKQSYSQYKQMQQLDTLVRKWVFHGLHL